MENIVSSFTTASLQVTDPQYANSANLFLSTFDKDVPDIENFAKSILSHIVTLEPSQQAQAFTILLATLQNMAKSRKDLINYHSVASLQNVLVEYVTSSFSWSSMEKACQVLGLYYLSLWQLSPISDRQNIITTIGQLNTLHPRVCFMVFDSLISTAISRKMLTLSPFLSQIVQYVLTTLESTDRAIITSAFELLSTILSWPFNSSKKSFSPPEKYNFIISNQFSEFVFNLIKTSTDLDEKLILLDIFNKVIGSSFSEMPEGVLQRNISQYCEVYAYSENTDERVYYAAASGLHGMLCAHGPSLLLASYNFNSLISLLSDLCMYSFNASAEAMEFELFSSFVESLAMIAKFFINNQDRLNAAGFDTFTKFATDIFGAYVYARLNLAVSQLHDYNELMDEVEDSSSVKNLLSNIALLGRLYPEDTIPMLTNMLIKYSEAVFVNSEDYEALEQLTWVCSIISNLIADVDEAAMKVSKARLITVRLTIRDLSLHLVNALSKLLQFCAQKATMDGSDFSPLVIASTLQLSAVVAKCCAVDIHRAHSFLEVSLMLIACPAFAAEPLVASSFVTLVTSIPHLVSPQIFSMLYDNPAVIYNFVTEDAGKLSAAILEALTPCNTEYLSEAARCIVSHASINFKMFLQMFPPCIDIENSCLDPIKGIPPSAYLSGIVSKFYEQMPTLASTSDLIFYHKFFSEYLAASDKIYDEALFKSVFEGTWNLFKTLTQNKSYDALDDIDGDLLTELFVSSFNALANADIYLESFKSTELEFLLKELIHYSQIIRTPSVLESAMGCIIKCTTPTLSPMSLETIYALLNDQIDTNPVSKLTSDAVVRFIDLSTDNLAEMKSLLCEKLIKTLIELPPDNKIRSESLCKLSNFGFMHRNAFITIISEIFSVPQATVSEHFNFNSPIELKKQIALFNSKIQ